MNLLQLKRDIRHTEDQKPNQTSIPSHTKQNFETRSDLNYDDVRIHYSSSHTIQRKIGMEYQTVGNGANVLVRENGILITNRDHGEILFKTKNGTKVTADGGDLEYVTPAVETPSQAKTAGDNAAAVHEILRQGKNPGGPNYNPMKKTGFIEKGLHNGIMYKNAQYCKNKSTVYVFSNLKATKTAHSQATVGIKKDKISDLLTNLGGTTDGKGNMNSTGELTLGLTSGKLNATALAAQKQTMLDASKEANNAVNDYLDPNKTNIIRKDIADRDTIVNLLSILIAYNKQFDIIAKSTRFAEKTITPEKTIIVAEDTGAAANAKNAMPVMSRTSLYDIYCMLSKPDKEIFLEITKLVTWRETPAVPGLSGAGKNILAGQLVIDDEPKKDEPNFQWDTLSLEEWLDGLQNGKDVMYDRFHSVGSLANSEPTAKKMMKKKFGILSSTDIGITNEHGQKEQGILAELRGLERGVPYKDWGKIAEQVARLVNRLNGVPENEG